LKRKNRVSNIVCSFALLVRFPEGIGMPPGLQGTASPRARIVLGSGLKFFIGAEAELHPAIDIEAAIYKSTR